MIEFILACVTFIIGVTALVGVIVVNQAVRTVRHELREDINWLGKRLKDQGRKIESLEGRSFVRIPLEGSRGDSRKNHVKVAVDDALIMVGAHLGLEYRLEESTPSKVCLVRSKKKKKG